MRLRIILAGAVAGLGLMLPTIPQVGAWHGAARGWVNGRLAEWDARTPVDEEAFVILAEPRDAAPPAPETAAVAAMEILPVPEVAPEPAVLAALAPAPEVDVPTCPMDLDLSLACSEAEASRDVPGFAAAQDEFIAGYDEFIVGFLNASEDLAARTGSEPVDLDRGLAFEGNRDAEGPDSRPAIAPIAKVEVAENLYEGLAYELNRGAEGLDPMPVAAIKAATPPSDHGGRLMTAVRLTRQAVHAWASLLNGPAVVAIGD